MSVRLPPGRLGSLVALVLAACRSDATEPTRPGPELTVAQAAGTYTLRSVGARALPASITGTSTIIVVSQATRTLREDGTCEEAQRRTMSNGSSPMPAVPYDYAVTCTWAISGGAITFRFAGAGIYQAARTTATPAGAGTLTETSDRPDSPYGYYPRVWMR